MKKVISVFCVSALVLVGCKEQAPYIKLDNLNYTDSSYAVATVPAADAHNVLVEEFTGATCSNCPLAHVTLGGIESAHEGRVNVIGMYLYNIAQTYPPSGAAYDFRDSSATEVGTKIYQGISSLPNGGVDRVPVNSNIQISSGAWNSAVNNRLSVATPVNITLASSYTGGTNTITVNLVYTSIVSTAQNLNVVIVEDSVIDKQEYPAFDPNFPSGIDDAYIFTNVFRQMVSSAPYGDPIMTSVATKNPGFSIVRKYSYNLKSKVVNPAKCRIIAFVTDATDNHVIQSVQSRLK